MAPLSHRHYVAVAHMLLFIGRKIFFSGHQQQLGRVAVVLHGLDQQAHGHGSGNGHQNVEL